MHIVLLHFYSKTPTPAYQQLASALRVLGHKVWIGVRNGTGDLEWLDGDQVIAVTRGPVDLPEAMLRVPLVRPVMKRLAFLAFMRRVRAFLQQCRPEIVQVNHASFHWLAILPLLMPSQMQFVLDFRQVGQRGATDLAGRLKGWWTNAMYRINARVFYDRACFLHTAGARKVLGESWSQWATVVPLGVNRRFLTLDNAGSVKGEDSELVQFVYVGTLSRIRQLEQVLLAAKQMSLVTRNFRIAFVGPDRAQGFYHGLVSELELNSIVTIHPPAPHDAIPELVSGFDVALAYVPVRPEDWQYHPTLKVMEYRALGIPIIASDNVPNRDVVENGVNGLLVENSIEGLAEGMIRFVRDRDLLRLCRSNAQKMRQGKTWSEVAGLYEQTVYMDLLNGE